MKLVLTISCRVQSEQLLILMAASLQEALLKALGARGVVKSGGGVVQVVIGPEADLICSEIKEKMK